MTVHPPQRVLVLGATGMLGSTVFRTLCADPRYETFGTIRNESSMCHFDHALRPMLIPCMGFEGEAGLLATLSKARADVVINCVGIIKQLQKSSDPLESLAINAALPHRLARYCDLTGAKLIHFSTDCVFAGKAGQYREDDVPDATDLYGRSKLLGEVVYGNAVTLRTSIIGHELASAISLVDWFLSQIDEVKGFTRAIFSGLPTIEIGHVLRDLVLPNPTLRGLYHLSVDPINKHDLLNLVAEVYAKDIRVTPDERLVIDRSLNSDRFRAATGFIPKSWPDLIRAMHDDYCAADALTVRVHSAAIGNPLR